MQRDLFQIPTPSDTLSSLHSGKSGFLEKFRLSLRFDHVIVLFLGLIFLYAFIYSIGVDRGKRLASQNIEVWQQKIKEAIITETVRKDTAMVDATKIPVNPTSAVSVKTAMPVESEGTRAELVVPVKSELTAQPSVGSVEATVASSLGARPEGKYTIQVVTMTRSEPAAALINKFSKNGYQAFTHQSGKYVLLCVSGFEKMSVAVTALNDLKGKDLVPADAYVRNMPS